MSKREIRLNVWAMIWMAPLTLCLAVSPAWSSDDKKGEEKEYAVARDVLKVARLTLLEAVEVAQQETGGVALFKAIAQEENEKHLFEVYFLQGGEVIEVAIDVTTRNVVEHEEEAEEHEEEGHDEQNLTKLRQAVEMLVVKLPEAVATAQQRVQNGKPFEVEVELENGRPVIEVELLADQKIVSVEIDGTNGEVLEVEEEEEGEDDEDREEDGERRVR